MKTVADLLPNKETYSSDELNILRLYIESMNKTNQIKILELLHKKNATLNENKYGVHINLTDLSPQIVSDLIPLVQYIELQEKILSQDEQQKEYLKNNLLGKDIKENPLNKLC